MDTDTGQSNTVIISNQSRVKLFYNVHKNTILIFTIPLVLSPVAFIGHNNAYVCFYVFLTASAYWMLDVFHPAVTSLIPIALATVASFFGYKIMNLIDIRNILLDCFGILIYMVAVENGNMHKRVAVKILLVFGCSHYRLCFVLYFSTMLLSMWISNTLACGLMMPIVNAIIIELEKMGILDVYETVGKVGLNERDNKKVSTQRPTDFTVFYFLGIAYSSSIGGMATIAGSQTNQICVAYSETIFPNAPKVEFPQFALLTLPGVLLLETLLYLWMNFYFLGLFRIHSYSALQSGSTEEEKQYVKALLTLQYDMLGKININEVIVCCTAVLWVLMQITALYTSNYGSSTTVFSPTIACVLILFIFPIKLDFLKLCRKGTAQNLQRSSASKPCLSWKSVTEEIHWGVLMVTGSSCALFEALRGSKMTDEFEMFLRNFEGWPATSLVLVVVLFCKILTEFAGNSCVAKCMLHHIVRVSLSSHVNPHSLMLAATLASSLPFHTIVGTPANAMVSSYFNISHRRMIYAGIGPTVFSVLVVWCTVAVWAKVIWTDIAVFPVWATNNTLTKD